MVAVELGSQAAPVVQVSRRCIGRLNLKTCARRALLTSPRGEAGDDSAGETLAATTQIGNHRLVAQQTIVHGAISERRQPFVDPQSGKSDRHDDRADDALIDGSPLGAVPLEFAHCRQPFGSGAWRQLHPGICDRVDLVNAAIEHTTIAFARIAASRQLAVVQCRYERWYTEEWWQPVTPIECLNTLDHVLDGSAVRLQRTGRIIRTTGGLY